MADLAENRMTSNGSLFSTEGGMHPRGETEEASGGASAFDFQEAIKGLDSINSERTFFGEYKPNINAKKIQRELTLKELGPIEEEIQEERRGLVEKEFAEGLSSKESRRLVYLEWQLDRLDDALHGEELDRLEELIELHERTAIEINDAINSLNRAVRLGGQRTHGRRK